MTLGDTLKITDVCMDFEPYFKVHNLVSVQPKSIILGQMTNLNMIFHVAVSVHQLVTYKIWNWSQFPDEFRNGQLCSSRKYPCPPQGRLTEIPRGREVSKAQFFEQKYDNKMEFPEGWGGGFKLKNLPWEGYIVWIFSGTTHCKGHGFESFSGLTFFRFFNFTAAYWVV